MDVFEFRKREASGVDSTTEAYATQAIAAAIEVHRHIGPGHSEIVYRKALSKELLLRGIPHACEVPVTVEYKGEVVGEGYIDILVAGCLVLELKSVEVLNPTHRGQAIGYLAAKGLRLALLMNFNVAVMKDGIKRVVFTQ